MQLKRSPRLQPHRFFPTAQTRFFFAFQGIAIVLLPGFANFVQAAETDCLDTRAALEYWRPIRAQAPQFAAPADTLAVSLVACLRSPSPELRDQIGYALFTLWLRSDMLSEDTRRNLLGELALLLATPAPAKPDDSVFARSFSALILAEVMRADSKQPFMSDSERQALLDLAVQSIERENDYRGLDAELGWIHPVAHMSDLLWRFALHPETSSEQAESILAAVQSKVAPTTVFYGSNESDRLARVVTTVVLRKLISAEKIATWLQTFEAPTSMQKWSDAFASPEGMAELHNTKLFLRALSDQLDGEDVDPVIAVPLAELVQGFTQLI